MTSSPLWCHDHTPMTSSTHYIVIDSSLTPHDVTENPNCWLTGHMTFCCTLIGPFVPRDLYPAFWLICTVVAPLTTLLHYLEATVTVHGNHCGLFSKSFILNFESIIQKQMGADFSFMVFIGTIGRLALNPGLKLTWVSFSLVQKHFLG